MQITKMAETVRRHVELTEKMAKGIATADERHESARLAGALLVATGEAPISKTRYATVSKAQFEAYVNDEMTAMAAAPDAARLALLKRNVTEVERQVIDGAEVFAIELPVIEKLDPQAVLLARIEELEKKFDARMKTGVGDVKVATPEPELTPEPTPEPAPAPDAAVTAKDTTIEDRVATLKAQLAEAEAELEKKGKPFPGAAAPFGPDGKPVEDDEKKMVVEAACGSGGGKKVKKDDDDDDDNDQGEVKEWGDLAKSSTPKDGNEAYRMLKSVHRS